MSDKPKPCLCGSEVKLRPQIKYPNGEVSPAYIRCVDCGLTFTEGGLESDDQLIANWNQRPVEEWLRERAERAEAAIQAMWPIFALALAYGEHGRSSEQIGLRKMADAFRVNPPAGVLDTIFAITDAGKDGGK